MIIKDEAGNEYTPCMNRQSRTGLCCILPAGHKGQHDANGGIRWSQYKGVKA